MSGGQAQTIIDELIVVSILLGAILGSMLANTFIGWGRRK